MAIQTTFKGNQCWITYVGDYTARELLAEYHFAYDNMKDGQYDYIIDNMLEAEYFPSIEEINQIMEEKQSLFATVPNHAMLIPPRPDSHETLKLISRVTPATLIFSGRQMDAFSEWLSNHINANRLSQNKELKKIAKLLDNCAEALFRFVDTEEKYLAQYTRRGLSAPLGNAEG